MKSKGFSFFIITSIVLITAILTFSFFRYYTQKNEAIKSSIESFNGIKDSISTAYLSLGTFESSYFSQEIEKIFNNDNTILTLVIHRGNSGVEYLYARNRNLLKEIPDPRKPWIGEKTYSLSPFLDHLYSDTINLPDGNSFTIEAVFSLFSRNEMFRLFRDGFSALLVVLGIIIAALFMLSKNKTRPAAPSKTAETVGKKVNKSVPPEKNIKKPSPSPHALQLEADLLKRVTFELERAASFDQDLTLVVVECINGCGTKEIYADIGSLLVETVSFKDLIFEYGESGFAIIIPNSDLDITIKNLEVFLKKVRDKNNGRNTLRIGVSSRNGRLVASERLLKESVASLKKAKEEKDSPIVGFRSDPNKYRDYISARIG